MPSQAATEKTKKFLRLYGLQIARAIADTPLFFAGVVGQKCNESGYGTASMAVKYNNFGGISGQPPEAISSYVSIGSDNKRHRWAIFATPEDCFRCYARVITSMDRYSKAMQKTTPEAQIKAIVDAGYCAIDKNMPSSTYYVSRCQGAIDVARQVVPIGTVTSANLNATIASLQTNLGLPIPPPTNFWTGIFGG